jgi:hypothetical protein
MPSQHAPQSGSRRPTPSVASHTGQHAGKTRSSAATTHPRTMELGGPDMAPQILKRRG